MGALSRAPDGRLSPRSGIGGVTANSAARSSPRAAFVCWRAARQRSGSSEAAAIERRSKFLASDGRKTKRLNRIVAGHRQRRPQNPCAGHGLAPADQGLVRHVQLHDRRDRGRKRRRLLRAWRHRSGNRGPGRPRIGHRRGARGTLSDGRIRRGCASFSSSSPWRRRCCKLRFRAIRRFT
jgi:hypothetical protein